VTPEALRELLDRGGARPAPYWPQTPEPADDAPYLMRRAWQRESRACWNRRMALVEQARQESRQERRR
jgi:hypothetical protein